MAEVVDSILNSIKSLLGIPLEVSEFDGELIIHINTVFMFLHQLGLTEDPLTINSNEDEWSSFTGDISVYPAVKSYIFMKVKMMFDPPDNQVLSTAYRDQIKEFESRLETEVVDNTVT